MPLDSPPPALIKIRDFHNALEAQAWSLRPEKNPGDFFSPDEDRRLQLQRDRRFFEYTRFIAGMSWRLDDWHWDKPHMDEMSQAAGPEIVIQEDMRRLDGLLKRFGLHRQMDTPTTMRLMGLHKYPDGARIVPDDYDQSPDLSVGAHKRRTYRKIIRYRKTVWV